MERYLIGHNILGLIENYSEHNFSEENDFIKGCMHYYGLFGFRPDTTKAEEYFREALKTYEYKGYIYYFLGFLYNNIHEDSEQAKEFFIESMQYPEENQYLIKEYEYIIKLNKNVPWGLTKTIKEALHEYNQNNF